ncbi:MAG TPA: hypothetical protein PLF81_07170 [Candidatus Anammoximicrobium sp.]|nr:hypothetical protein [Candidatus Anammoximicrobium sp.]
MPLDTQQAVYLTDLQGRSLGQLSIDRIERDRLFGRFTPTAEFESVRPLFDELEAAVNEQLFHEADRLSGAIDQLGLQLAGSGATDQLTVCDVQVMNESAFCCRIPNLALTQLRRAVA